MRFRDRLPYSALPERPPLRLPGDTRLAVWIIVNVEDWDEAYPMPRQALTAPSGAQVVPDLPNWAWHEYGMRVGFWRIRAALARHGIRATLSCNGRVCLTYPPVARAAMDDGWEFMGHGYFQRPMHLVEDQRAVIRDTLHTIERFTGQRPVGWLGPGLTQTLETTDLLAEAGLRYCADWVVDDEPVRVATAHGDIVGMPYSVELNDIPLMMIQHHEARHLKDRVIEQFERLYAEGADRAKVLSLAVHPYITGVPHRIRWFEEALAHMAAHAGVRFMTGADLLDWYDTKGV